MAMTSHEVNVVKRLEIFLGYTFKNPGEAVKALTPPRPNKIGIRHSYEYLEFIGDRVLNLCIVTCLNQGKPKPLFKLDSEYNELTTNAYLARTYLASRLRKWLIDIETGWSLPFELDGTNYKVLADVVEAVLGAVYIDSEYDLKPVLAIYENHLHLLDDEKVTGKDPSYRHKFLQGVSSLDDMPPHPSGKSYLSFLQVISESLNVPLRFEVDKDKLQPQQARELLDADTYRHYEQTMEAYDTLPYTCTLAFGWLHLTINNDIENRLPPQQLEELGAWKMLEFLRENSGILNDLV